MSEEKVVLLLSDKNKHNSNGLYETSSKLKKRMDERGIKNFTVFTNNAFVEKISDKEVQIKNVGEEAYIIEPRNTVAIMRNSAIRGVHGQDVVETLENLGVYVMNSLDSTILVNDKHKFGKCLVNNEILTPKTMLIPDEDSLDEILKQFEFPAIFKTLDGSQGVGVFKIDSKKAVKPILQTMWQTGIDILIQEYVKNDGDIRTIVLGGEIIGSMKRKAGSKDFRNNVSQGGSVEKYNLSKKEKEVILKSVEASGCEICGVDHITSDGEIYIIEVNSSPGTSGFSQIHETIIDDMIDFALTKTKQVSKKRIVGIKENISIIGIGKFLAKLDTGNGRYSVLHGSDIKIKDNEVSFKTNKKKYTYPLAGTAKVKIGAVSSMVEERPFIELDVKIGNVYLEKEKFFITNRDDKSTEVLLSNGLLRRAKLIVDPTRTEIIKEGELKSIKDYLMEMLIDGSDYENLIMNPNYEEQELSDIEFEISDDALIFLSMLGSEADFPIYINNIVREELFEKDLIDDSNNVTDKGIELLKTEEAINRLIEIGVE